MNDTGLDFYRTPGPLTTLPTNLPLGPLPTDLDHIRTTVQGLLVHRDWVEAYGVTGDDIRLDEQHLRTTADVLERAVQIRPEPLTARRDPVDRVLGICRHFTLLHVALLRAQGVPARVRCGFGGYFTADTWHDHWITERWDDQHPDGGRWIRDDPQIDDLQAARIVGPDFDPHDQVPGRFLTGAEAWVAARASEVDPMRFGIFDMWGMAFIAGNVLLDLACLNKVELLPWDAWGLALTLNPYSPIPGDSLPTLDELATLVLSDDTAAIRSRYDADDQLRVPPDFVSYVDGEVRPAHLPL